MEPNVTVEVDGKTLEKGVHYTLSYKNNQAPGIATVTVTGVGIYFGTIEENYTIKAANVSKAEVSLSSKSYTYNGKKKTPAVTVTLKGCKNLKTITIRSTNLKTVGKEALKGINAKAKIKVPAKKLSAYKKLLGGKGQGSKVKIVKN